MSESVSNNRKPPKPTLPTGPAPRTLGKSLTAEELKARQERYQRKVATEARRVRRQPMSVEDLRDEVMSLIRNSGKSYQQIEADGGPTVGTLTKWDWKVVKAPTSPAIRAALRAIGKDIGIVDWIKKGDKL